MRILAIAFALTFSANSIAYDRAAEILENCAANPNNGPQDAMKSLHCSGYLTGVVDGILIMQNASPSQPQFICLPNPTSGELTLKDVTRWLQNNPARINDSARVAVLKALIATYPCPQE